jgi:hypothetical protein
MLSTRQKRDISCGNHEVRYSRLSSVLSLVMRVGHDVGCSNSWGRCSRFASALCLVRVSSTVSVVVIAGGLLLAVAVRSMLYIRGSNATSVAVLTMGAGRSRCPLWTQQVDSSATSVSVKTVVAGRSCRPL